MNKFCSVYIHRHLCVLLFATVCKLDHHALWGIVLPRHDSSISSTVFHEKEVNAGAEKAFRPPSN